jgi:hypothetical protein
MTFQARSCRTLASLGWQPEDSSGNSSNDLDVGLTLNHLCLRNPPVENRNTHIHDSLARLSCKALNTKIGGRASPQVERHTSSQFWLKLRYHAQLV